MTCRRKWGWVLLVITLACASWAMVDAHIRAASTGRIYADTAAIPARPTGILLGAPRLARNGSQNSYYRFRVDAAEQLFRQGKITHIVVSDDDPEPIRRDLLARGIPANRVSTDQYGARTIQSITALRDAGPVTLISQHFHNQRALYLARHYGVDAIAFDAREVEKYFGVKTRAREQLARLRMLLELAFDKPPASTQQGAAGTFHG
ncbi:hypothetical protein IGB42_03038 [Andreprevotia sp. IGB-42]|uniref:SanA/YdcF family protein n=1 Tax=Andreprevotia sp. IGB-42 TaxID=2497473 RepID=UPI001357CA0C|nr:ElyC/SanA/YdcF family protein [Andreprevotia sp. IGB-42]KAF0812370.1 hypothetical protein IGB42_03038 [Andreprevotia sp. IGB-42]